MPGPVGATKRILLYESRESEALGDDLVKYLRNEGFTVERAITPEQAVEWARDRWYRVHILGFEIARDAARLEEIQTYINEFPPDIPKIIHTDIQGFLYDVLDGIQNKLQKVHIRVEFVQKVDYKTLMDYLQSFERDVRLCFNDPLQLESNQYLDPIAVVMGMLERVDPIQSVSNKSEVDDLFRRTFLDCDAVEIQRELWHKPGRVALLLRACFSSRPDERFIGVVVRKSTQSHRGLVKYTDVPKVIRTINSRASPHYSLTIYQLEGDPDWRRLRLIQEFLDAQAWDAAERHLARVSDYIVGRWQRNHPRSRYQADLSPLIRAQLELTEPDEIITRFKKCLNWLEEFLPAREGIGLEWEGDRLHIQLSKIAIPIIDPVGLLQAFLKGTYPGQIVYVPAQIDPATILVDPETGYVWLTELDGQGDIPRYWPETDVELCLRAVVADSLSLDSLTQKVLALNSNTAESNGTLDSDALARLIASLRGSVSLATETQQKDYEVVLAYKSLSALCHLDLSTSASSNVRECYRHFIQLALILQDFLDRKWIRMQALKNGFIEYDSDKDGFTVDGQELEIAERQKKLLKYFIEHSFKFLSYDTIAREVLGYSEDYIKDAYTDVRLQIQQIKSRIYLRLRNVSPSREYFDERKNGYFFKNPPGTRRKGTNHKKR